MTPDSPGPSSSPVPSRWYETAFQSDYLERYRRRSDAEAEAAVSRLLDRLGPRGPVLDLCCGGGRHLRPLLRHGLDAYGVDLSAPLLAEARRGLEPEDRGRVVRADMRHLPFATGLRAVLSFFTSFGYFESDADNDRVLFEVARVLGPGGWFVLDLMDRDWTIENLVPESQRELDGRRLVERRWVTSDGRRVEKESVTTDATGMRHTAHESVRIYTRDEIEARFRSVGLEVPEVWGSFGGEAHLGGTSRRMIVFGKKV